MMETRATGSSSNRPTRGTASKYDFVKVFFFFYGLQPSKLLQVQASFRDVVQWIRKTQERQRPITRFSQVVCNFIRVWSYMCHEVLQKSRRMSHRCLKKNPFGWNCPKKNLCFCCPRITVLVEIHTSKNKKKKKRGKWGHVCMCALDICTCCFQRHAFKLLTWRSLLMVIQMQVGCSSWISKHKKWNHGYLHPLAHHGCSGCHWVGLSIMQIFKVRAIWQSLLLYFMGNDICGVVCLCIHNQSKTAMELILCALCLLQVCTHVWLCDGKPD
jgi:hypothetical protein